VTDYAELFRELAVPRLVGTSNHQKVREILKRELAARGFVVDEHQFTGRPARALFGTPREVHGINLIAQRSQGGKVWLVAHYDSKGQPISMAIRLVGFAALVLGLIVLALAAVPAIALLVLALIIVSQNRVTDNSPGAVDNASALIAIFMTIDQLSPGAIVGVVFPDAEEFGLVGARALAADRPDLFAAAAVINLDGVDDVGRPLALLHRPGKVGAAVAAALGARRARWLPVIVDGIALARVSRECVTILKGNWRTMRIVHRPEDDAARVRLDGAATVAAGLARVLRAQ
jgi:uncharacterized membrane protein YphA (DoxX/SURF4 family)